jgi:acyl-CoA synthetase (AMP-forming)/AMP-acid ligase II
MSAPPTDDTFNIAGYLPTMAERFPHQAAIVMPEDHSHLGRRKYSHLTFRQLDALCDAYAHGLVEIGFQRGDRVLLLVSQGLELIALTFALFKIGAAPILIDPGMGRDSFLRCIEHSEPRCLIGIPRAFIARALFRKPFRSVEIAVCTRSKWYAFGAHALPDIARPDAGTFAPRPTTADERAAILFTSGSTGPAKGVLYTHGIFDGQVQSIRDMYDIEPGEVAVPAFPLFALFSVAMGMTCVIPDFDPAAPADCNPAYLVEAIEDFGADMAFGSPAIWTAVARYCEEHDVTLDSLSRMLMFGAAIPPKLQRRWENLMAGGRVHTPYGATESLPVATISSEEVLADTATLARQGRGICVGRPVDHVTVRIIAIDDGPLETWDDVTVLDDGEVGEITVSGSTVTRGYDRRPEHDALSKISDGERLWHRMGDLGYFDDRGRLWFCGRKSHRVPTADGPLFTVQCEAIFNEHPDVYRSALIGLGDGDEKTPAIVIESEPGKHPTSPDAERAFREQMLELAATSGLTRRIEHVLFRRSLPVDRRHNAKIHRGELAREYSRTLQRQR